MEPPFGTGSAQASGVSDNIPLKSANLNPFQDAFILGRSPEIASLSRMIDCVEVALRIFGSIGQPLSQDIQKSQTLKILGRCQKGLEEILA